MVTAFVNVAVAVFDSDPEVVKELRGCCSETVGETASVTFVEEWLPRDGEDVGEWLRDGVLEDEAEDVLLLKLPVRVGLSETRMVSLAFDDWVAE